MKKSCVAVRESATSQQELLSGWSPASGYRAAGMAEDYRASWVRFTPSFGTDVTRLGYLLAKSERRSPVRHSRTTLSS
jgi:hypothetical protein